MNKLTFSILLVGLFAAAALARSSPQTRRPFKFTPGQTYIYEYRGRQWNGVAKLADQYSGLNLECDVILQALQSGSDVVMKLDDVKVDQIHTQSLDQNDIRKLNKGREQNEHQITMYKEELAKPIRFSYLDGKVVRFSAETGDAEWSINIKKSILSLLQLDLAPTKTIRDSEMIKQRHYNGYPTEQQIFQSTGIEQQAMPLVYPIYEETFGGICETLYQIDSVENVEQQQREIQYADVLNVTKTVNYKNCLTDPSVSYDRHAFDVNTQTFKGQLFSKQPYVESLNLNRQQQQQQQFAHSTFDLKDTQASEPVDRYSFTKYNISTVSQRQPLINGRYIAGPFQQSQQQDVSIIEGVYSEGKIKYQAEGDLLVSDTQQSLKLITCAPTSELAHLLPEISGQLIDIQPKEPTVQYETIQCELSQQKLKFYQAVSKFAQVQQSLLANEKPQTTFYNHKLVLPYALSASWYPLVASGKQGADEPAERLLDPEELAKSYEQLLVSLADDIIAEDVAQSKKAGEKIIRLVNAVAFMPKYKLTEVYERIIEQIKQAKQQQMSAQQKQSGRFVGQTIDNELVSKWKVVRKLYLDSLPLAGSKQAIEMIEQLIESQIVKDWEAKEMCEAVPANLRYPDTEIIDAFIRISQLPHVRKNRQLFASSSIAVGKMIGSAYIKTKDTGYIPTATGEQAAKDDIYWQVLEEANNRRQLPVDWMKTREQRDLYERLVVDQQDLIRYIKLFKQLLTQAQSHHEKIVYIETLAHMRVAEVLPILEPIVSGRLSLGQCLGQQSLDLERPIERSQLYTNKLYSRQYNLNKPEGQFDWTQEEAKTAEECNYMRALTIYALAHVVRSAPGQVQAMLLPVFDNTYEPYQIRIAAFTTLSLAPVDDHVLQRIASQMWREPNKEVASFVVGTIDTMSKMTAPMMAPWKEAALKAAESMPKQYLDTWKFSWFAGGDHYNHQKQTGRTWVAEIIKSNVSTVPRAGYFHYGRYHGNKGHKFDNVVELGFTSKGIESLIKDYITYCQQRDTKTGSWSLVASIMENLYEAKDDLANYYRESRDNLKKSILMPEELENSSEQLYSKNYHFKRQQPIQDVNSKLGKLERKGESLFDVNGSRSKRSVTIKARNPRLNKQQADAQEEPKVTLFTKLFDSTSYHSLDRKAIVEMLEKSDDYIKMIVDELVLGGKLHYVKMIVPSNMWHMVPTQMGLPMIVTHRSPMVFSLKLDGSKNGQLTSNLMSQYFRLQQQQQPETGKLGQNYNTFDKLNITALVHPKIIHSNFRFLFAVDQANCEAYGVQVEKSHQVSLPMELSVAYSQPKQLVSFAVEPKTQMRNLWVKETAKTFIGPVSLASFENQNWLGQEQLIRTSSKMNPIDAVEVQQASKRSLESIVPASIISGVQGLIRQPKEAQWEKLGDFEGALKFEHRFVEQLLGLELQLEGMTDDQQVVAAIHRPEDISMSQEEFDELSQHSNSGPFAEILHLVDAHVTRPSKYLEFYSTIKPSQTNKSPVYRFNFVVDGTTGQQQQQQTSRFYNKNIQSVSNTIGRRGQKTIDAIDTKIIETYNQQPLVEVY